MQSEARSTHVDAVEAHPVSELLACPPQTGILLTASAQSVGFDAGQTIFRQGFTCEGLYLVVSGLLMRRTERLDTRIVLGNARPGDLLELAAALGDPLHTFSLIAQTQGSLLLLPIGSLQEAFQHYPPLRMRLLEELAREVSRGYRSSSQSKVVRSRRSPRAVATD
jgi:CRP-like cAMP-binding protein